MRLYSTVTTGGTTKEGRKDTNGNNGYPSNRRGIHRSNYNQFLAHQKRGKNNYSKSKGYQITPQGRRHASDSSSFFRTTKCG